MISRAGIWFVRFGNRFNPVERVVFILVVQRRDLRCDPESDGGRPRVSRRQWRLPQIKSATPFTHRIHKLAGGHSPFSYHASIAVKGYGLQLTPGACTR